MKRVGLMMVMATVTLAGCGETKLIGNSVPDETQVVDGPSLALPPSFELRPPRQADDYETILRAQKGVEARALITGVSGSAVVSGSASVPAKDQWLIEQTGVKVDTTVREQLVAKPVEEKPKEKSMWQRWFGKDGEE